MVSVRAGQKVAAAVVSALITVGASASVEAGETNVYLKTGWFTWSEKINGSSFVKEQGFMHALGLTHRNDFPMVTIGERAEIWGGNLDYDGHDLTGAVPLKSDTNYIGTREEFALSTRLPRHAAISFEPLLAVGHKFWARSRSSEIWNTFYGKAGGAGEFVTGAASYFLKGGAIIPIYTWNHVDLSDSGLEDLTLEPKGRVSAFAEGGVKAGAFTVSIEYEGMEFGESTKVATRTRNAVQGVVVVNRYAYQPASSSHWVSLRVSYTF